MGLFQTIIAAMPPHDTYIELFLGSGAIMRRKPPAETSFGVDIDRRTINDFDISSCPHALLICSDAVNYLTRFDFASAGRVLIYADPPYVQSTRNMSHRYRHEMDDAAHIRLLEALRGVPASVMLSGYPNGLYDEFLGDWRTMAVQVMTRGGPRTEKLWMNFEDKAAHWATYAGTNFTDRQRIKRKAARWKRMYDALPPGERLAILAQLLAPEA